MGKTDKQRLLIYKAVNRLRNRDIAKHSKSLRTALDRSIEPLLKRVEVMGSYNDNMLILIDEQPLKEAIRNIYETTAKTFAKASERKLLKQVKKEFTDFTWSNKINTLLNDNSEGGLGMLITNMNSYTKKLIAADVKSALDSGVGIGDLAGYLSSKYKDINRMRGLRIGRTETIKASNYGSLQGAYASGIEFVKEWNSIGDSRTRGSHRSIDGKQALQDEPFNVGGYKMLHPADSSLGAAAKEVVNCRCVIDFIPIDEYDAANSTNNIQVT